MFGTQSAWDVIIFYFFVYCFIGWCIECVFVAITEHKWENRGFLKLPMLPIYGTGAVIMLIASCWIGDLSFGNVVLTFLSCGIAATVLEYLVGTIMEALFKVRYWDYSDAPFNLNGHVCLFISICWGILGVLLKYVIHPFVNGLVDNIIPVNIRDYFIFFVGGLFIFDVVTSTARALKFRKTLEVLAKAEGEIEMAIDTLKMTVEDDIEDVEKKLAAFGNKVSNEVFSIIRNNSTITSLEYHQIIDELKDALIRRTQLIIDAKVAFGKKPSDNN